jgi:hypothetical protein
MLVLKMKLVRKLYIIIRIYMLDRYLSTTIPKDRSGDINIVQPQAVYKLEHVSCSCTCRPCILRQTVSQLFPFRILSLNASISQLIDLLTKFVSENVLYRFLVHITVHQPRSIVSRYPVLDNSPRCPAASFRYWPPLAHWSHLLEPKMVAHNRMARSLPGGVLVGRHHVRYSHWSSVIDIRLKIDIQ